VPPEPDFAHVSPLNALQFLTAKSTRADFAFEPEGLQLHIEAHAPGVYRLRCGPTDALLDEKPGARARQHADMLLARHEAVGELAISSIAEADQPGWRLEQGDIVFEIRHSPLTFTVSRNDTVLLRSAELALGVGRDADGQRVWQVGLDLDGDDAIHGLGATHGDLDRHGLRLWSDNPADKVLPLAWSPKGWGVYVSSLGRVGHDVGALDPETYRISVSAPLLDVFLFIGDPSEILNQYSALTGRAGQPGLWPMGVWLDQAPGQTIAETLALAGRFREQGWALDAVQLAAPVPYDFQPDKPVFEWDARRIADPRAMLAAFQQLSVQVVAPTFPGVPKGSALFDEWEDRGWLLIDDDSGSAHVFAGCAATGGKPHGLLDLTNKDVYALWVERQRQMLDEGVAAPACDAQLNIPDGITARGGETGATLRTVYPLLARRALFDAFSGHKTPQEGVVVSADLFPGVQRYAWQRGPQVANDWEGLAQSLRMALALGSSGVPVQTHALGNPEASLDTLTPELYVRWLAACVFSGNFNFQGLPGLLPDAFGEGTRELVRHWLQWRYRLVPYVLGIIEDAVRTGLPVQRSMAQAFPADPIAHVWDAQYLFGPALLVAPVLQPGTEVKVYLPAGEAWWDLNTGWRYEGGTTLTVEAGLETLPVFGREGHMLCLGPIAQHTGEFNSARLLDEVWMFGMPEHSPVVMRNKIRVMQMQGSSYIKGLEGLRILPSEGLEVKRRGAEVRISRIR